MADVIKISNSNSNRVFYHTLKDYQAFEGFPQGPSGYLCTLNLLPGCGGFSRIRISSGPQDYAIISIKDSEGICSSSSGSLLVECCFFSGPDSDFFIGQVRAVFSDENKVNIYFLINHHGEGRPLRVEALSDNMSSITYDSSHEGDSVGGFYPISNIYTYLNRSQPSFFTGFTGNNNEIYEAYSGWSQCDVTENIMELSGIDTTTAFSPDPWNDRKRNLYLDLFTFCRVGGSHDSYPLRSCARVEVYSGDRLLGSAQVPPLARLASSSSIDNLDFSLEFLEANKTRVYFSLPKEEEGALLTLKVISNFDTPKSWTVVDASSITVGYQNSKEHQDTFLPDPSQDGSFTRGILNLTNPGHTVLDALGGIKYPGSSVRYTLTTGSPERWPLNEGKVGTLGAETIKNIVFNSPLEAMKTFLGNWEAYYTYLGRWYSQTIRNYVNTGLYSDLSYNHGSTIEFTRVRVKAVEFLSQFINWDDFEGSITSSLGSLVAAAAKLAIAGSNMSDVDFLKWMINHDKIYSSQANPNDNQDTLKCLTTGGGYIEMYDVKIEGKSLIGLGYKKTQDRYRQESGGNMYNLLHPGVYHECGTGRNMPGNHSDETYTLVVEAKETGGDGCGEGWTVLQHAYSENYPGRAFVRTVFTPSLDYYEGTYGDWKTIGDQTDSVTSGSRVPITSGAVYDALSGKQGTLSFTGTPSGTNKVVTQDTLNSAVAGASNYLGTVTASNGLSTSAKKGDFYRVSTAWQYDTTNKISTHVGDIIIAEKNSPSQAIDGTNWSLLHNELNTDTLNTAGSSDTSSKIFLVGTTSQTTSAQTYSHDTAYVGTDGCLYSGGTKVLTAHQSLTGKQDKITASGILKGNGSGSISAATAGTDYIKSVTTAAGANIASVGTPSVSSSTDANGVTTLTFNNLKGATGGTGARGSLWYSGTSLTATSGTQTLSDGISHIVGDMYLNTSTWGLYKCTTAGTGGTWTYQCNIKGATGGTGGAGARGATWTVGDKITGTAASGTQFTGSGITSAILGDMYLNSSTWNIYKCTTAGNATNARWSYIGNIKGEAGTSVTGSYLPLTGGILTGNLSLSWAHSEDTNISKAFFSETTDGTGNGKGVLSIWNTLRNSDDSFNSYGDIVLGRTFGSNGTLHYVANNGDAGQWEFTGCPVKIDSVIARTASNGSTWGKGSSGQVLKTNGTTVYWASDNNSNMTQTYTDNTVTSTYPLLLRSTAGTTTTTSGGSSGRYNNQIYFQPSTGTLSVPSISTGGNGAVKLWTGTQAQYNAIATKDASTLYFIS